LLAEHAMPVEHNLPRNLYAAKKLLRSLGLHYERIPVCGNGCVLFRKEHADLQNCPHCSEPKMHLVGNALQPVKVLRYFPIIPRLKRLYATSGTSGLMTWHHENKSTDGMVRHPADSKAWKHVDTTVDPTFAYEPRNVRLGLALDGVNPFGNNSTTWSTWPILLVNYNIPPWLATKKFFVMLGLLIPGPNSVTEPQFDIFMAPLLEELQLLWKGVDCFDVLPREGMGQQFKLRAIVLWTINDYPAYGLISGQQHSGYRACVICGPNCVASHSKHMGKLRFMGHRRWLPLRHPFRSREVAKYFDGEYEGRPSPDRLSSSDRLAMAEEVALYLQQEGTKSQGGYAMLGIQIPIECG
jgi:Transposase family tnp2